MIGAVRAEDGSIGGADSRWPGRTLGEGGSTRGEGQGPTDWQGAPDPGVESLQAALAAVERAGRAPLAGR